MKGSHCEKNLHFSSRKSHISKWWSTTKSKQESAVGFSKVNSEWWIHLFSIEPPKRSDYHDALSFWVNLMSTLEWNVLWLLA